MPPTFHLPATGARVAGHALLLAIDDAALPLKHNLCYFMSKPQVRREPVLLPSRDKPDAPDYIAVHLYGTVIQDAGRFRLWYYANHLGINPDWPAAKLAQFPPNPHPIAMGPICYAESADGIHWVKPDLGQVLFRGSRANNAIDLPSVATAGAFVIRDDADPDPARRYKMVYNYYTSEPGAPDYEAYGVVRSACSPDGLRWTAGPRLIVPSFFEMGSFYRHDGLYVIHGQKIGARWCASEGGHDRGRQGFAHVSADFEHWLPDHVEAFALPDPRDPAQRSMNLPYDQVHLGVGAASFGTVCVGLFGLWHNAHFTEAFGDISGDLNLVLSNDGLRFREPVKGHVFLGRDESPVTALEGGRPLQTILAQGNGILNVGDETRIYHGRWRNCEYRTGERDPADYYGEIALATLPRDRWGALGLFPDAAEGSAWTTPITLPTGAGPIRLTLNAEGIDGMSVQVADERFAALAPFSGGMATGNSSGGLDCPVRWAGPGLEALAGRTVRFRIATKKSGDVEPRIYAVNLRAD